MRADGVGLQGARRILLHGVTGSGKTTLAARLGTMTGLPWAEAVVRWHFQSFAHKRELMLAWEADRTAPPVLRPGSPGRLESWLATVTAELSERSR